MVTQSNHNDTGNIYASSKRTHSRKELSRIAKEQYDIDLDESLELMDNEPYDKDYEDYLVRMVEEAEEEVRQGIPSIPFSEVKRQLREIVS